TGYSRPGLPYSGRDPGRGRHRFRTTPSSKAVMVRDFQRTLKRRAQKAGAALAPDVASRFETYFTLLARWNARINLTALNLESGDAAIDRLLIEPLLASRHVKSSDAAIIDIGSGGGSPAIPLAIAAP